ncbi:hypothetical protein JMUB3935_0134 [Leptotrichia trevisanii]|jgi:hypothetical protein|uniref:Uncharacterized protein n=1 Tax=Leptotrichia trevisanii TaxID=109328 RepID=A0A510JYF3_9FUSO|nr:hypothetical protein [Leptotrichia trevisanii]BBM44027.1 hypothetical protein JMUB3870_0117 [Leptotrichia trevisanii]BBM51184.1 hypothetical protein JMUB3935_0134 [Leptotrichia trevisanii]
MNKQETLIFFDKIMKEIDEMPIEKRERLGKELNNYVLEYYANRVMEEITYKIGKKIYKDDKRKYEIDSNILAIA